MLATTPHAKMEEKARQLGIEEGKWALTYYDTHDKVSALPQAKGLTIFWSEKRSPQSYPTLLEYFETNAPSNLTLSAYHKLREKWHQKYKGNKG